MRSLRPRSWWPRRPPHAPLIPPEPARRDRQPRRSTPRSSRAYKWRSIGPDRGGTLDRRERRQGPAEGGVLRRRRRRALEDDGRRAELGAGHRRPGQERVRRRGRRVRVESRRRLHRHGRVVHPRQHHARRRRLQVHRRRQDVDARRVRRTPTQNISKIRVHPTNPDIVFVAVFGQHGAPNDERGVFKTTDGGKTWKKVLYRDDKTGAIDISIDRTNPNVLYAAMWEAYRVEYQMSSGGPGSGLFKSTDGGETWTEITRNPGLPQRRGRDASACRCRARTRTASTRSSRTRTAASSAPTTPAPRGRSSNAEPQHPPARVLLHAHLRRSEEQGRRLRAEHVAVPVDRRRQDPHERRPAARTATITTCGSTPTTRQHLVNGNDGGGAILRRGGRRGATQDFPTAQFYHVDHHEAHAVSRLRLAAGQQHGVRVERGAGRLRRRRRRRRGQPALRRRRRGAGLHRGRSEGSSTSSSAARTTAAFLTRFNRRTGQLREVNPYPRMFQGEPSSEVKERWQWTYPIIFSPVDPKVLYASSQHVWKTTNGGQTLDEDLG